MAAIRHFITGGFWILPLLAAHGLSADGLTGNWKPVTGPPDDRARRLVRISLTPIDETGGLRYAEAGGTVYEGKPGQLYPAQDRAPLAYELVATSDGELGIRTFKDSRTAQWQTMRVAEDGNTLLVSITSWDEAGLETQDGLYYRRTAESECGIHWERKPDSPLYGCWLWPDGQRMLDRQPAPIIIEAIAGGYRLISPAQIILLRKGGSALATSRENSADKSPVSRWRVLKAGIEIAVIPAKEKAAGTMRLELTGANSLWIKVVNTNGAESSYTYRRE